MVLFNIFINSLDDPIRNNIGVFKLSDIVKMGSTRGRKKLTGKIVLIDWRKEVKTE